MEEGEGGKESGMGMRGRRGKGNQSRRVQEINV